MIEIDLKLRDEIKAQKLRNLMIRYIELDFDRIANEANGLTQAVSFVNEQMETVRVAYETIQNS